jgi:hypothetical protein
VHYSYVTINRLRLGELSLERPSEIQAALIAIGRRRDATYSRRWARIALEVLRRLPGDEDEYEKLINYQNAASMYQNGFFVNFLRVSGAASSVTKER